MFCQLGSEPLDKDRIIIWGNWWHDPVYNEGNFSICEFLTGPCCYPGWPQTLDPLALTSQVLGSQECTTMPGCEYVF
jgi:hypothetical protein